MSSKPAPASTVTAPDVSTTEPAPARRAGGGGYVPWLSLGRLVAIVGVVTIHVVNHIFRAYGDASQLSWHLANVADAASRIGVPLFVVISGAVLLRPSPDHGAGSVREFYTRRASRIAIPLVVWTAFFLVFDRMTSGEPITAYTFVQGYLWGRPFYHLYFLYVIAGLYVITPFLRVFVAAASRRSVTAATVLCLAFAFADQAQHVMMGGGDGYNAFSYFVPWVGFYLLGAVLASTLDGPDGPDGLNSRVVTSGAMARRRIGGAAAVFAGAILTTAVTTWLLFRQYGHEVPRWSEGHFSPPTLTGSYFLPTTVVATIAMAVLLWAITTRRRSTRPATATTPPRTRAPWTRQLADLTFGIFLLHPIPLYFIRDHQPSFTSAWSEVGFHLAVIVGLLVGCGIVTSVVRRIPGLRRLV